MLHCGSEYEVENYKDYKNRTIKKHLDKIKNQMMQIKQCSLKGEDKQWLLSQIGKIIIPDPQTRKPEK